MLFDDVPGGLWKELGYPTATYSVIFHDRGVIVVVGFRILHPVQQIHCKQCCENEDHDENDGLAHELILSRGSKERLGNLYPIALTKVPTRHK